jgi:nicotinate-nucleotide--dimethylbenzimidazole phosphoribosyltransferase
MDRIKEIIKTIKPLDTDLMNRAQKTLDNLTKPQGSLGRLEELAKQVVGITQNQTPGFKQKVVFTMASDHGVVEEGISAYPQEVTAQMVYNFIRGGAGVNVLARHVNAKVIVVDMGVREKLKIKNKKLKVKKINFGTKNMTKGPAMTKDEAIRSIEAGIDVFEEIYNKDGIDILGVGDMGIGNTTASSAIVAIITGRDVLEVTGRGTGITEEVFKKKVEVIKRALGLNKPDPQNPIDILAKVGGFEIGGICGATLAAASSRIPVIIDGFISSAGALLAHQFCPILREYLIASHTSVEVGHRVMLDWMGLQPLFNLNLRLGEGTGAALGMSIVEASIKIILQMATFGEAGVSENL